MQKLLKSLKTLKKLGINTVKKSFEDEGSSFDEVQLARNLTSILNMKLNVKIGGCEAKNDMIYCQKINVDGIIAPMIETPFAYKKFIQTSSKLNIISYKSFLSLFNKYSYGLKNFLPLNFFMQFF